MPRLSVILPARNAEDTVARAVSSTLRALPSDAELVVLDDGSTDNTADRAVEGGTSKGVVDKRLRVESEDTPGGIATALNWLLEHTDSAIVARMDADDVSLPTRFRAELRALDNGDDYVFPQVVNATGRKLSPAAPVPIPPTVFPLHLLLTNPVSHPAMVARRHALDAVGGYREVPAEDYDLWMRAALDGASLRRMATWGLLYSQHPGQITASESWRNSSWRNPVQAEVFTKLSQQLTGVALQRIVAIALTPSDERTRLLAEFERAITPVIARVPAPHRQFLQRKLRGRLRWAREFHNGGSIHENHL